MSGGQRQRALLGQGLVARADVLLVDESTAGVDVATQAAVLQALTTEAQRGVVVVHATHEPAAAAHADSVLALRAGRVDVVHAPPWHGADGEVTNPRIRIYGLRSTTRSESNLRSLRR
ncbi:hypothetical protein [Klenkia marina]|uniref:hypothetical protein n=1 Tax=Klenkia marina TaxID=1960309 RepID=UPI003C732A7D